MILDHLDNWEQYVAMYPLLRRGFEFLFHSDIASLRDGRNEIDGADLYAMAVRGSGKGKSAKLEAHRKYIDIQFSRSGEDTIGWKATQFCSPQPEGYSPANDIEFFRDAPETYVRVPARHFAVFFPSDAHAPMSGEGPVDKIVVKVRVE